MRSIYLKKLLLPLIFLLLVACSNENTEEVKVIDRETFIKILAEAQQFESTQQFVRNKNVGFDLDESYVYLFEKHQITREDFETSLTYYSSNPEDFEQMYDEVIVILTEKQALEKN